MKVVFFNSCKKWGGGEKWHHEMAVDFNKKNIAVTCFADPHSKLFAAFASSKINVAPVSISGISFLNPIKIINLSIQFKKLNPDFILLNLSSDVKCAGLAAKLAGIKNIIYRRGSAIPIKNSVLNRLIFKHIVSDIIANTIETKKTILSKNQNLFPENKIKVIHNGIKKEEYLVKEGPHDQAKDKEIIFGNLARLSKQKGQNDFIRIAQYLQKEGLNFKILIGGDGELESTLKSNVKKANLEDKIIFLGFIENVSSFYNSIDIFLFPSIWEGFGFSLIEAKLFKKPIVAYNVSSNPEVVQDNIDGILVPLNDIEQFSLEALKFAQNHKRKKEFGQNGYNDVLDRFIFSTKTDELVTHLQHIVS